MLFTRRGSKGEREGGGGGGGRQINSKFNKFHPPVTEKLMVIKMGTR